MLPLAAASSWVRDVPPGRALAPIYRQVLHQREHVGERGERDDIRYGERAGQRSGPVRLQSARLVGHCSLSYSARILVRSVARVRSNREAATSDPARKDAPAASVMRRLTQSSHDLPMVYFWEDRGSEKVA